MDLTNVEICKTQEAYGFVPVYTFSTSCKVLYGLRLLFLSARPEVWLRLAIRYVETTDSLGDKHIGQYGEATPLQTSSR
jgi:hypothetical protein